MTRDRGVVARGRTGAKKTSKEAAARAMLSRLATIPPGPSKRGRISADWVEMVDPQSGQPYYFREVDGATQWERPSGD